VRRVVLFEGMFIGLISWVLGTLLALPFGYWLANAVSGAMLESRITFTFSTTGLWLWLGLVLVIATLSSLAPAQRASQLTIREVLAYE
jgi:putative ABC transport system permease protein